MTENMQKFMYTYNRIYEITIGPDDKHQFEKKDTRYILSREHIRTSLEDTNIKYCLYQEFSHQQHINTKSKFNRVHYHGIIVIPRESLFSWVSHHLNQLRHSMDIQVNEYRPDYWYDYCTKQRYLYESSPIPVKQCLYNMKWGDMVQDYGTHQAEG